MTTGRINQVTSHRPQKCTHKQTLQRKKNPSTAVLSQGHLCGTIQAPAIKQEHLDRAPVAGVHMILHAAHCNTQRSARALHAKIRTCERV
eukprot:g74456.t1